MFKNRKLTVTVDKKNRDQASDTSHSPECFEKKADIILHKLESLGAKMFLGVCVYIVLDTHRQVSIEKVKTYR